MFYPAIVLDNNTFKSNGKIKVRVSKYYFKDLPRDFSDNPSFLKEGYDELLETNQDFYAHVLMPFGGGVNNGLFMLPRPNTKGLVAVIGEKGSTQFVWMGSYTEETNNGINIPNDNILDETGFGAGYNSFRIDNKNDIILRTKSLDISENYKEEEGTDSFNWRKNKSDNIITIGTKKIKINHIDYSDESLIPKIYEEVYIGKDFVYNPETKKIDKEEHKIQLFCTDSKPIVNDNGKGESNVDDEEVPNKQTIYKQKANAVSITMYGYKKDTNDNNVDITSRISIEEETGEIIIFANERTEIETRVSIKPTEIVISSGPNMSKDKNDATKIIINKDDISLEANQNIYINATKDIRLGGRDEHIVTTKSPLNNFPITDGIILSSSPNIFA